MTKSQQFAEKLTRAGVEVSETGAVYKDPKKIISSEKAQKQLASIAKIRQNRR
ncbi:MAG: hypothetical protein AAF434_18095 [Pseudomonadota bacterium]